MKITKKQPVKASDEIAVVEVPVVEETVAPEVPVVEEAACACKYQPAIDLISSAIESLAEIAQGDQIAKDSIANLGVVLLDLKGGCC